MLRPAPPARGARGWGFAGALTLLYGALYGLLVSEDNALVLGSLMLFAILAAIMLATRRIDWYAPLSAAPPPLPPAQAA
jgi:inner membrane protein